MAVRTFPTAREARQFGSKNLRVLHAEIRHIETRVMDAADLGRMAVTVDDSPFGGGGLPGSGIDPVLYWRVAQEKTEDSVAQHHIDSVLAHFSDLGYAITAKTNPTTGRTIRWEIQW